MGCRPLPPNGGSADHRGTLQVPESVAGREPFAQLAKLMEVTVGWVDFTTSDQVPKLGSFFRDH